MPPKKLTEYINRILIVFSASCAWESLGTIALIMTRSATRMFRTELAGDHLFSRHLNKISLSLL